MTLHMLALLLPTASAGDPVYDDIGYGDVDPQGYPSWEDRDVFLWTNAARVAPRDFEEYYVLGGCSSEGAFSPEELIAKKPLHYSRPLNFAARYHSEDMRDNDHFDHSSSDGTPMGTRVSGFYSDSGSVGENIAVGYSDDISDGHGAVFTGWMCSTTGHRANIMSPGWLELGTGTAGAYATQNFGGGSADSDGSIRMGLHLPKNAQGGDELTFYGDYAGSGLDTYEVVFSGIAHELELSWGNEERGVFSAVVPMYDDAECEEYYFLATDDAGEHRFPETGSYQFGPGCNSDEVWIGRQFGVSGRDDKSPNELLEDIYLVGCSSTGAPAGGLAAMLLAGLALVRRRRD